MKYMKGCSQMMSAAKGGQGGGPWKMMELADKGGRGGPTNDAMTDKIALQ